jgi:carbon starvation protein
LFSFFVWLALILVIAVFAWLCADTFVKEPKIVLPSLGLIPVAMLIGYLLYHLRVNTVLATILGLSALVGLIFLGNIIAIHSTVTVWVIVLMIYCFFASILPVDILLQPRDYLSSFLLFFGMGAGYLGLALSRPKLTMPHYISFSSSEGYLWPALFITVACGAVSGFHALIASGTTSKQIANERYAKRIGFGGMITEALVAVLAIIAAAILFMPGDNFNLALKNSGPIGIFGKGYGLMTLGVLGEHGQLIAITILNAFILTTLDTATRISRYLSEEIFNIRNRYISTFIIILLSATLALSGKWQKIWPAFGASNQLVAALALFVLSCWLLSKNKPAQLTLIPAFFMLITTVIALILQMKKYARQGESLLFFVSLILIILAGFMTYEVIKKIYFGRKKHA